MICTSDAPRGSVFLYPGGSADPALRSELRERGIRLLEPADLAEAQSVLPEVHADLYLIEAASTGEALAALGTLASDHLARETPALVLAGPLFPPSGVPALFAHGAHDVVLHPHVLAVTVARIEALLRLQRRLHEARELSMRDALTGLYNRRFFFERLEQEIARSNRTRQGLAVVLFDVDWFKKVNDTFGHPTGDAVLRRLAETAERHSRRSDVVARMGGDEFALLLCANNNAGALSCAQALRRRLADTRFDGQPDLRVSLSMGIADYPSALVFRPIDDIVRLADAALLRAKARGRDRIEIAGS